MESTQSDTTPCRGVSPSGVGTGAGMSLSGSQTSMVSRTGSKDISPSATGPRMTSATSDRVLFSPSHTRYISFSTLLLPSPREPQRLAHGGLELDITERPPQLEHHGCVVAHLDA